MKNRVILLAGLIFGTFFPPAYTTFVLGFAFATLNGGLFGLYDPSAVTEALGFYFLIYLVAEAALAALLFKNKAGRIGLGLTAFFLANLLLGVVSFLSMMPCGLC